MLETVCLLFLVSNNLFGQLLLTCLVSDSSTVQAGDRLLIRVSQDNIQWQWLYSARCVSHVVAVVIIFIYQVNA